MSQLLKSDKVTGEIILLMCMPNNSASGPDIFGKGLISLLLFTVFTLSGCGSSLSPETSPQQSEKKGISPGSIVLEADTTDTASAYLKEHFDPDHIGFIVYDIDSKEVLFSHNRDKPFIPASTAKIPTVIHALDTLGSSHRFTTELTTDGKLRDGILEGNLYLHGSGDPSFDVSDIVDMVSILKKKGVRNVKGKFHYDRSSLPRKEILDPTMDLDQSYNTGVGALSTEYNYIDVRWSNNNKGATPSITLTPDLPMFGIRPPASADEEKSIPERVQFTHSWQNQRSVWQLSPHADTRGHERLPVRRPSLYTAQLFTHIARIQGIDIPWPTHGIRPKHTVVLVKHSGDQVEDIAEVTMHYSINIYAELLFLNTAKKLFGEKASYDESARMMEIYTEEIFSGINWAGYNIENGSGLSSRNKITPEQMLALLIYADAQQFGDHSFSYFLQPSGWNYSLRNRFHHKSTAFHIFAKTGTINYAVSLAGYIHTRSGRHLLFVFLNSNEYLRYLHEKNPDRYKSEACKQASRWNYAYRHAMDSMIEQWIYDL